LHYLCDFQVLIPSSVKQHKLQFKLLMASIQIIFNGINSVRAMYVVKKEFNFNESTLKNGQLTAWRIKGLSACKSDPFG